MSESEYSESDNSGDEEIIEFLSSHLPVRKSRGRRYNELVGEELEADEDFWGQEAWKQKKKEVDNDDDGYEYESMEDEFDSDYRSDKEGEDDDDDDGANQKAIDEEEKRKRRAKKTKNIYKDPKERKVKVQKIAKPRTFVKEIQRQAGLRKSKRSSARRRVRESEIKRKQDKVEQKKKRKNIDSGSSETSSVISEMKKTKKNIFTRGTA